MPIAGPRQGYDLNSSFLCLNDDRYAPHCLLTRIFTITFLPTIMNKRDKRMIDLGVRTEALVVQGAKSY